MFKSVGVMFVGPDIRSHGGIAKVIENYQRSEFWEKYKCIQFSTCRDWNSAFARMVYSLWRYIVFGLVLISSRPTVVSIHTAVSVSYYRKLGYIILSRLLAIPVVVHIHPSSFYEFFMEGGGLRKFAVIRGLNLSERLVFLSQQSMGQFRPFFQETRMTVIPNPVDVEFFESQSRQPAKGNYRILFVGWIIKEKGVYDIVDVIPEVITRFPQAEFLFAGNKEVERLKKIIEDRKLSQHAKVLGWVGGKEVVELYRTSRLLLLPSYTEGVPNVILEAMSSGLPAITCPVGGIPSVFAEGENGYFVSPGDTQDLAARIIHMLEDDDLCDEISHRTGRRARTLYSIEVVGRQLENIYENFLPNSQLERLAEANFKPESKSPWHGE